MFGNIGISEIVIVGAILLLLFGSKKIKELARGMGEASKELKNIQDEISKGGGN